MDYIRCVKRRLFLRYQIAKIIEKQMILGTFLFAKGNKYQVFTSVS